MRYWFYFKYDYIELFFNYVKNFETNENMSRITYHSKTNKWTAIQQTDNVVALVPGKRINEVRAKTFQFLYSDISNPIRKDWNTVSQKCIDMLWYNSKLTSLNCSFFVVRKVLNKRQNFVLPAHNNSKIRAHSQNFVAKLDFSGIQHI